MFIHRLKSKYQSTLSKHIIKNTHHMKFLIGTKPVNNCQIFYMFTSPTMHNGTVKECFKSESNFLPKTNSQTNSGFYEIYLSLSTFTWNAHKVQVSRENKFKVFLKLK